MLDYSDFYLTFEIYTDASKHQLGVVRMQNAAQLPYYFNFSIKLYSQQTKYIILNFIKGAPTQETKLWSERDNIFSYNEFNNDIFRLHG